jgi:uncharacterized protein YdeI (YjbR/CyaY-like superfamily)
MPVTRPAPDDVRIFSTANAFRGWLKRHHGTEPELWIGYYKKAVPKTAMTYVQAVEEALCFGWIDGITYRMSHEVTATRFTPRRRTSVWSATNIERVARLTESGRMTAAGLRAFEERDPRRDATYSYEQAPAELPPDMIGRFRADAEAWAHWDAAPPSFRRQATFWVTSAKQPATRERRFLQLLEASRDGRRPKPFIVEPTKR